MRASATIIVLILFWNILVSQNTFELRIPMESYQAPGDITIDNQGNYIIPGISFNDSIDAFHGILFKVSATGEVIKSISYFVPDSTCCFTRMIKLDSNYLVFGGIGPISSGWTSIMICSFDFELNFQWRKNYLFSGEHELATLRAKIDYDNNIVLLGSATKDVKYNDPDPFLFKCNQQGDSLKMVVHSFEYWQLLYDFLIKSDSSGYISFAFGRYPGYPPYHSSGTHYSNTYSLVDVTEIPDESFHSTHTAKWINDHEFLVSGNKHISIQYTSYQGVGLKRMDTSFSILQELDYAHFLDTISYPGWERSFDWLNFNDIFFTWTKNYDDWLQTVPSWMVLTKLDSNFNVVYERFYGGDAMYSSYFIEATDDGGCIMVGIIYEYEGSNYDLYLIKTDENGLTTSIEEDYFESMISILPYPNPCTDRIAFDHDLTLVDIFNHSGQLVLRFQNYNQFSDIAVGKLQSGVYIYRALTKEGGFTSGKFVKR